MGYMTDFIEKFWVRQGAFNSWGMFFAILGLSLSIVAILGLFYFTIRHRNRCVLLITVLGLASFWHAFIYALIFTGFIRAVPEWYNKGIPLYYLIAPCAYFFVLFSLFPRLKWPRYAWLHLLPFVFGLIDMIPYAMASIEEKRALLERVVYDMQMGVRHEYGYIDQKWHYIAKFSMAFIYLIAQWRLIYLHDMELSSIPVASRRNVVCFSIVYTGQLLLQGGMVLSLLFNSTQSSFTMQDIDQLTAISFFYLVLSCWLLQQLFRNFTVKNGNLS
jgi:hypothetical protein